MNVLFLCTSNVNRSKTCEDYFRQVNPAHNYKSAGLSYKNCERFNSTICTHELLLWADVIYVFEDMHIDRLKEHHSNPETFDKIINLEIDDVYEYMSDILISKLSNHPLISL